MPDIPGTRANAGEASRASSGPRSFVPADVSMREMTVKAIVFGLVFSVVLGAANAYLGLKAGMTVSAVFPAAVLAMAFLRPLRGTVLEENIARTTGAVGEALAAGAVFTLPAMILTGVWSEFRYWEATAILVVGGVIGTLFVILLRRPLCDDVSLPFPESVACAEIVKAGQKGRGGAGHVFGAMGLAGVLELFKNPNGLTLFGDYWGRWFAFSPSTVQLVTPAGPLGHPMPHGGGLVLQAPLVSPALMGVGYIIGPRVAAINFAGGVLCWFVLVPLALFFDVGLPAALPAAGGDWQMLAESVWRSTIRPIAVGAMLVGAVATLARMRGSLADGLRRAVSDLRESRVGLAVRGRLDHDIPLPWILAGIGAMTAPMFLLYLHFCGAVSVAAVATLVMLVTGFLFSAVGGYLVGMVGGSNQPISGIALSTLIVAALVMLGLGVTGSPGVAAVLATTAVICCAASLAGGMIQDLKVGRIIGGTPWKLEIAVIVAVVVVGATLVFPMEFLHRGVEGGIGGAKLPAPQAGLMALMSKGIVGGSMAWSLVGVGAALGLVLVLLRAPSPMLVAVGMYLPFETTFAIFLGGLAKWLQDRAASGRGLDAPGRESVENTGILLASGLVAGEAICGVVLAALRIAEVDLPKYGHNPLAGMALIPVVLALIYYVPLRGRRPAA